MQLPLKSIEHTKRRLYSTIPTRIQAGGCHRGYCTPKNWRVIRCTTIWNLKSCQHSILLKIDMNEKHGSHLDHLRRLAMCFQPRLLSKWMTGQVAEATELFKAIGEAYLCLRDPAKRAAYDYDLDNKSTWSTLTIRDIWMVSDWISFSSPHCNPAPFWLVFQGTSWSSPQESDDGFTFTMAKELFEWSFPKI